MIYHSWGTPSLASLLFPMSSVPCDGGITSGTLCTIHVQQYTKRVAWGPPFRSNQHDAHYQDL